ncbi:Ribonuclease HI [Fructilactobacillus florum 8D]|uniref:Ribonuclease H n=1 Tax=Fructilactobacillus florum 8D TaxID=1221538 RepID=W9EHV1_9LACO|nr:ribonuclease H family protein [Fructilactobacillus florum]EKK20413.1 Ribonuclease HI [Fructilactobacillus florum 2F]ETO40565.1 Ribonuclease HI [Fructilactobacillus florum 8D]
MVKKTKYYAVKNGRKPGIYLTWSAAERQVKGFANAQYQSFSTEATARAYLGAELGKIPSQQNQSATKETRPAILVFTDGGSRNHGNVRGGHVKQSDPAAWAYLIDFKGQQHADTDGTLGATNNQMEIMALIQALRWLVINDLQQYQIGVISDSRYVLGAIKQGWLAGWKRRGWQRSNGELKNKTLWQQLEQELQHFQHIQFGWTKGHATNRGNVYVDKLLNQTMDQLTRRH